MTVKLQADSSEVEDYLFVCFELKLRDASVYEAVKANLPQLRYEALKQLSAKKASELSTPEGMAAVLGELRIRLNRTMEAVDAGAAGGGKTGSAESLRAVLLSSFDIRSSAADSGGVVEIFKLGREP